MNLLHETTNDIRESGHTPADIIFIGSEDSGHQCSWDEFKELADVKYDNGYGAQEVASDLIIVFSDGSQMWRREYDGSESWYYSPLFKMPETSKKITSLIISRDQIGWATLKGINDRKGDL